ncbi:universal stress protein [Kineococcus sp. SYSU DK001]|uniref:universal stress protein n=1 Tax=Kineococcus sp. SYSU DK001 TaxID=3383122 RepID=UPI003D7E34AA
MSADRRRYVVAYDGEPETLQWARTFARSLDVALDVVVVVRSDDPFAGPYPPVGDITGVITEQARGWAQDALALLRDGDGPPVEARADVRTAASVPEGLLEAAAETGAAAVVVGAASGLGVGPVARTLLHASPVPVVLVPRREPRAGVEALYVAVGTRPGATAVLEEAWEAAVRTGLPLHVVSLVEHDVEREDRARVDPDAVTRVQALVEEIRANAAPAQVSVEVGRGRTMAEAVSSIDWAAGGLLIVGSARLAQGRQTFLGPTAARILRHVPVPVVVVPRHSQQRDAR